MSLIVVACHASICCRLLLGCAAISEPRSYHCKAGSKLTVDAASPALATPVPSGKPTGSSPFSSPSPVTLALGNDSSEPCPKRARTTEHEDERGEPADVNSTVALHDALSELMRDENDEDDMASEVEVQPVEGGKAVASEADIDSSLVVKHEYGHVILQDDTLLVVKASQRKTFPKKTRLLTCLEGSFGFKKIDEADEDDPVLSLTFTKYTKVCCLKSPDAQILEEEESTIGQLMKKHDVVLVDGHTVSSTGALSQSCPKEEDCMRAQE